MGRVFSLSKRRWWRGPFSPSSPRSCRPRWSPTSPPGPLPHLHPRPSTWAAPSPTHLPLGLSLTHTPPVCQVEVAVSHGGQRLHRPEGGDEGRTDKTALLTHSDASSASSNTSPHHGLLFVCVGMGGWDFFVVHTQGNLAKLQTHPHPSPWASSSLNHPSPWASPSPPGQPGQVAGGVWRGCGRRTHDVLAR